MRSSILRLAAAVGIVGALPGLSVVAAPMVILEDGFESYADQAAFEMTWSEEGTTTYHLDTGFGAGGGRSVKLDPVPTGDGSTNRWFRNLGGTFQGSDAQPLVFSYDLYLHPDGASTLWANAVNSCDVRGYTGGVYKKGNLSDLLAIGAVAYPGYDRNVYQGRVYADGVPQVTSFGYLDLNAPTAPQRLFGWHHLEAVVTSNRTRFRIDDQVAGDVTTGLPLGINCIVVGTGWAVTAPVTMWVDNVRVEIIPEPGVFLLLALGGMVAWRRR